MIRFQQTPQYSIWIAGVFSRTCGRKETGTHIDMLYCYTALKQTNLTRKTLQDGVVTLPGLVFRQQHDKFLWEFFGWLQWARAMEGQPSVLDNGSGTVKAPWLSSVLMSSQQFRVDLASTCQVGFAGECEPRVPCCTVAAQMRKKPF